MKIQTLLGTTQTQGSSWGVLEEFLYPFIDLLFINLPRILFSLVGFVIVFAIYKVLTRQLADLRKQARLEPDIAFTLRRILQWVSALLVVAVVFAQFGVEIGILAGFTALAGGTIIGFAAMNTIGNSIAGIIVMVSRPFKIGDRISFKGEFAEVEAIGLIFTKMRTLSNISISIPNQELLKFEIENYAEKERIRREYPITLGYDLEVNLVEDTLLEAAREVEEVVSDPEPFVRVTDFKDYAAEYRLYVFLSDVDRMREIDASVRRSILATCKRRNKDVATPSLVHAV